MRLENGEALVISVTPVGRGLAAPLVVLVALVGGFAYGATQWSLLHRYEAMALVVVGVVPAVVVATRTWRWRSYKITVTTQRVIIAGGVLARHSTQINLGDVIATHADQTVAERLRRRGVVSLDTPQGPLSLPAVRHPAALRRLIDRTRRDRAAAPERSWDEWFVDPNSDR